MIFQRLKQIDFNRFRTLSRSGATGCTLDLRSGDCVVSTRGVVRVRLRSHSGQVVHTHPCASVTKQYNSVPWYRSMAAKLCSWETSCRSYIALGMRYRLGLATCGFKAYGREMMSPPTLQWSMSASTFTLSFSSSKRPITCRVGC